MGNNESGTKQQEEVEQGPYEPHQGNNNSGESSGIVANESIKQDHSFEVDFDSFNSSNEGSTTTTTRRNKRKREEDVYENETKSDLNKKMKLPEEMIVQNQIQDLKAKLSRRESGIDVVRDTLNKEREQNETLRKNLMEQAKLLKASQDALELEKKTTQMKLMQERESSHREKILELETNKREWLKDRVWHEAEIERLRKHCTLSNQIEQDNTALREEIERFKVDADDDSTKIRRLESDIDSLHSTLHFKAFEINSLKQQLDKETIEKETFEKQMSDDIAAFANELDTLRLQRSKAQEELENLKPVLEEKKKLIEDNRRLIEIITRERTEFTNFAFLMVENFPATKSMVEQAIDKANLMNYPLEQLTPNTPSVRTPTSTMPTPTPTPTTTTTTTTRGSSSTTGASTPNSQGQTHPVQGQYGSSSIIHIV